MSLNTGVINNLIPTKAKEIVYLFAKYGKPVYFVGGCVRDILLKRTPHDWDMTTSTLPDEIIGIIDDINTNNHTYKGRFKVIPTGIKHGTVTIILDDESYEITTFRTDGEYTDGRRPDSVNFVTNINEDLSRRDFTMNAIAYHMQYGFIDPFNGIQDIENKVIRCVGNPNDRFSEDKLRILRMYRFSVQLGFDIEINTLLSAKNKLEYEGLEGVSKERIRDELIKIINKDTTDGFIKHIDTKEFNYFLSKIIPEWTDMIGFRQENPHHIYTADHHSIIAFIFAVNNRVDYEMDFITRFSALFHDIGKPHCYQDENGIRHFYGHAKKSAEMMDFIMKDLRFDNDTREKVVQLIGYHDATIVNSKPSVKRWLNKIGEEQFRRLLNLRRCDRLAHNTNSESVYIDLDIITEIEKLIDVVNEENSCFSLKDLAINGHDVMQFGFKGKEVGGVLNDCLNKVISEELPNDRDSIIFYIRKLMVGICTITE